MAYEVSLYIPVYNAEKYLDSVVQAVMAQTYPIQEVLIINDGSTDNSKEIVKRYTVNAKYPVRLINHDKNQGLGAARNTGVRNCKTEYIASIDSDAIPEPDWLENIMKEFVSEDIAGVGGCMLEKHKTSYADKWRNTHMRQCWGNKKLYDVAFLFGSNTCYKTENIINVGMYDEMAKTNGEDVYISEQIRKSGKRIVFTPLAKCYHLRQDTVESVIKTRWRWVYFGDKFYLNQNIKNTLKANITHFKHCWRLFLKKDIFVKPSISNIMIDLFYPLYSCCLDWKALFTDKKNN